MAPPPAIIGRDPGAGRPVTVGAGGVTLGGALIALVMVAGLGGFGGWWRRRHGSADSTMDMRLRSLSSVPVGKEASVELVGAPGRTLMVGCSSTGVHLVSESPGEASARSRRSPLDNHAQRSLRQLFPDTGSSHGATSEAAPVTHEM
ncbi:MAG: flagellar biosynthetic protein FliO, partial [Myxococcota bacterium]|nr:flagellar biosynthetic protein FliO [Myxococcota bacterium]